MAIKSASVSFFFIFLMMTLIFGFAFSQDCPWVQTDNSGGVLCQGAQSPCTGTGGCCPLDDPGTKYDCVNDVCCIKPRAKCVEDCDCCKPSTCKSGTCS